MTVHNTELVRPEGWTPKHEVIAQALYDDTWTEPKPDDPHPDWHHRFQWWQCVKAANLIVPALAAYELTVEAQEQGFYGTQSDGTVSE